MTMKETVIARQVWTKESRQRIGLRTYPTIITATAEITHLGNNSAPFFHITIEEHYKNPGNRLDSFISGGSDHKAVAEHFPEARHLIKWHGYMVGKGPMHYVANTLYHLKEGHTEYAARSAAWGALPSDSLNNLTHVAQGLKGVFAGEVEEEFINLLDARLPHLNAAFEGDMRVLFGADVIERCQPFIRQ